MTSRILIPLALLFWLCPPAQGQESPAPPVPPVRVRVGSVISAQLMSAPKPKMSRLAKTAHARGTIRLEVDIDETGHVTVRHVTGNPLLVPAAVAAAQQYLYTPCLLNGDPVAVRGSIEIDLPKYAHVDLMR